MLIWITGISGSGKTTVGTRLYERLKAEHLNLPHLDGDEFRQACGADLGYTLADRDKNALRMTRLCGLICAQGIHVIRHGSRRQRRQRRRSGHSVLVSDVTLSSVALGLESDGYRRSSFGQPPRISGRC